MFLLFWASVLLGLGIAMPVGPVALMVIRYSLLQGIVAGLSIGVGTALADGCVAVCVGFCMSFVQHFLDQFFVVTGLVGGGLLIVWGITSFRKADTDMPKKSLVYKKHYTIAVFGFFLTLLSPSTLLPYILFFSQITPPHGFQEAFVSFFGVFTGAYVWWVCVSVLLGLYGKRLPSRWLFWTNKVTTGSVAVWGGIAVFYVLQKSLW